MKQGCLLLPCVLLAWFADSRRGISNARTRPSHRANINTWTSYASPVSEKDDLWNPLSTLLLQFAPFQVASVPLELSLLRSKVMSAESAESAENRFTGHFELTDDDPVLFSSRRMAAIRAVETDRRNSLVFDEHSKLLAGIELIQKVVVRREKMVNLNFTFVSPIVVRARHFDNVLSAWLQNVFAEPIVLILGAGMDTRSWRLPQLKAAHVIEGDSYAVLDWKEKKLGEKDHTSKSWVALDGDVSDTQWWVKVEETLKGYRWLDARAPYFVLIEGVSMYLDVEGMQNLLTHVNELATVRGSRLALSFVDEFALETAQNSDDELLQQWKWGLNGSQEVVVQFFRDHLGTDWEIHDLCDRNSAQIKLGVHESNDREASLHTFYLVLERKRVGTVDTNGLFGFPKAGPNHFPAWKRDLAAAKVDEDLSLAFTLESIRSMSKRLGTLRTV